MVRVKSRSQYYFSLVNPLKAPSRLPDSSIKNVVDSSRVKVPFGIGQIGKAFRNEITPRNYTFRSREFEQMELEFFIPPDEAVRLIHGKVAVWSESADLSTPQPDWGWEMWHRYWVAQRTAYYAGIGLGEIGRAHV